MALSRLMFILALCAPTLVTADPLSDMAGTWQGSGWAKQTQQGPQETVRCRINNSHDGATRTLSLSGRCVVPGRQLEISGSLTGTQGTERITGRWSNPDGIGSVRVVGIQRAGIVAFNFAATDPATGRDMAQNVEWRVSEGTLQLRSTDRKDPTLMMSDISFGR